MGTNKNIYVTVAETGETSNLEINEHTSASNILKAMDLDSNYELSSGRSAHSFKADDNLYDIVPPNAQLFASLPVDVGSKQLIKNRIRGIFANFVQDCSDIFCKAEVKKVGYVNVSLYHERRGWICKHLAYSEKEYRGEYQTKFGSFTGKVTESAGGTFELYIKNPPLKELAKHEHSSCFMKREKGWYWIHTDKRIPSLASGIVAVEQIIREVYEL